MLVASRNETHCGATRKTVNVYCVMTNHSKDQDT